MKLILFTYIFLYMINLINIYIYLIIINKFINNLIYHIYPIFITSISLYINLFIYLKIHSFY